jgi:hypothetical protein
MRKEKTIVRLIAIKPLSESAEEKKHSKILRPQTLYYFLKGYTIDDTSITHNEKLPHSFFSNDPDTSIVQTAIVGKNGSGKSSLIELLIKAINNLCLYFDVQTDVEIKKVEHLKMELYFQTDNFYKIVFDGEIFIYRQKGNESKFTQIDKMEFKEIALFYSVIVNYSHYALNELEIGAWINSLFHKNDGYQTPIVINPMRDKGVVDINIENSLAIARLIATIARPDSFSADGRHTMITDNLTAHTLELTLKPYFNEVIYVLKTETIKESTTKKTTSIATKETPVKFEDLQIDRHLILKTLNEIEDFGYKRDPEDRLERRTNLYIVRKVVKIAVTYPFYHKYFDRDKRKFKPGKLKEFLELLLKKNRNHISFKLRQAMNFVKERHIEVPADKFLLPVKVLSNSINKVIKKRKLKEQSIVELIPPPIFKINILMTTKGGETVSFDTLSSGERQFIYALNSVVYHLNNLDSIRKILEQRSYRYVAIVLEEIELYFHPDMQRVFASTLLKRIDSILFKRIKAIHLCYITHSPFILSDIPRSNILFLDDEGLPASEELTVETFGANIHDLMKHSFFMNDGSMGEFAREKITETILFLNYKKLEKDLENLRETKLTGEPKRLYDAKLEEKGILELQVSDMNPTSHKQLIDIIGEPLLKKKLSEMYDEIFEESELANIEKQIADLKERANKIVSKK